MPIVIQIVEEERRSIVGTFRFQRVKLDCGHGFDHYIAAPLGSARNRLRPRIPTKDPLMLGDALACDDCIWGETTEWNWDDPDQIERRAALDHRGRP